MTARWRVIHSFIRRMDEVVIIPPNSAPNNRRSSAGIVSTMSGIQHHDRPHRQFAARLFDWCYDDNAVLFGSMSRKRTKSTSFTNVYSPCNSTTLDTWPWNFLHKKMNIGWIPHWRETFFFVDEASSGAMAQAIRKVIKQRGKHQLPLDHDDVSPSKGKEKTNHWIVLCFVDLEVGATKAGLSQF